MSNSALAFAESGNSPPPDLCSLDRFQFAELHWKGMPEFIAEDKKPRHVLRINLKGLLGYDEKKQAFVTVQFRENDPSKHLSEISKRLRTAVSLTPGVVELETNEAGLAKMLFDGKHKIAHHACWFPWKENEHHRQWVYRQAPGAPPVNPEYPLYVISKGRWETLLTARALEHMEVSYNLVVEPSEAENYKAAFARGYDGGKPFTFGRIHVALENFSERGQGSIPVRNYVWDLARMTGEARHWLLDDNIPTFIRFNHNLHIPVETGAIFRAAEVFVDRYENIAIAGFQNNQFIDAKAKWPPVVRNSRVYSCTLIKNDLRLTDGLSPAEIKESGGRWRGRYNEDTDLAIRAIKAGWCTVYFNAFNFEKEGEHIGGVGRKGGNTEIYANGGRTQMAESLHKQHPNEVRAGDRWVRKQHKVAYEACEKIGMAAIRGGCELKLKEGVTVPDGDNNFGMVLVKKEKRSKTKRKAARS